jgi:hypothetical protein
MMMYDSDSFLGMRNDFFEIYRQLAREPKRRVRYPCSRKYGSPVCNNAHTSSQNILFPLSALNFFSISKTEGSQTHTHIHTPEENC